MKTRPGARVLKSFLRIVLFSYVGITGWLFVFQRRYIYYPRRGEEAVLARLAEVDGLVPWRDGEGRGIGWKTASVPGAERVLVFHGNAGSAVDRGYYVHALAANPGGCPWQVFLFEYPGYGARPGSPSESAIVESALMALDRMRMEESRPVFLLGESLGSGVAARLAGERPEGVAGLLLITPFPSLGQVAAAHYPGLPVRLLLRDRFDAVAPLRNYSGPVAVLVAGRDRVVPARLGRLLYDGYEGPKRLFEQADRDHNTLNLNPGAAWWNEALEFLRRNSRLQGASSRARISSAFRPAG